MLLADPASLERVGDALAAAGVSLNGERMRGALVLDRGIESGEAVAEASERLIELLQSAWNGARNRGFERLRIVADIAWLAGQYHRFDQLARAEVFLEEFVAGKPISLLCQYAEEHCPPDVVVAVLQAHQQVMVDGVRCPNPHCQPRELLLEAETSKRAAGTVQWLRAQLRHAARLETMSRAASEAAHDLNNMLTIIQGNCELALDRAGGRDPELQSLLGEIQEAARRGVLLTGKLLSQVRHPGPPDRAGRPEPREGVYNML